MRIKRPKLGGGKAGGSFKVPKASFGRIGKSKGTIAAPKTMKSPGLSGGGGRKSKKMGL